MAAWHGRVAWLPPSATAKESNGSRRCRRPSFSTLAPPPPNHYHVPMVMTAQAARWAATPTPTQIAGCHWRLARRCLAIYDAWNRRVPCFRSRKHVLDRSPGGPGADPFEPGAAAHATVRHLEHRAKTWATSPGFPQVSRVERPMGRFTMRAAARMYPASDSQVCLRKESNGVTVPCCGKRVGNHVPCCFKRLAWGSGSARRPTLALAPYHACDMGNPYAISLGCGVGGLQHPSASENMEGCQGAGVCSRVAHGSWGCRSMLVLGMAHDRSNGYGLSIGWARGSGDLSSRRAISAAICP